jgi:hypothetical protein
MKRTVLLILLFIPLLAHNQENNWWIYPALGVELGGAIPFPLSDIPDGARGTSKINPSLGLGFEYQFTSKWSAGIQVNYHVLEFSGKADVISQPFYYNNLQGILYFSGATNTDIDLRQIEFPIMALYKIGSRWSLAMGAYYSRIVAGTFDTEGKNGVLSDDKSITDAAQLPGTANTRYDFNDDLDKWDAGLLIGYRYEIVNRLSFYTHFTIGFNSLFKPEFNNIDYEMYQLRLNAGLSFCFFR